MKKKYVFNSEYTMIENEGESIILTSDMEEIYILHEIEYLIVKCFVIPKTIDEAISELSLIFNSESFNLNECVEFINQLIASKILEYDTN